MDGILAQSAVRIRIKANSHVEGLVPQVKKIGNLVGPIILGDQGEAAVIAYDSRIRTLQNFTNDPDLITVELFTKGTGESEFGFHSQRTLQEAMQRVGEELHSEYTIGYSSNNKAEDGFHQISVEVTGS